MMPAQHIERAHASCTRYGFHIFDHPLQDPKAGFYIASWETRGLAQMAAHCLGLPMTAVEPVTIAVPQSDVEWRHD
jgi:hypothetical protein